MNANPEFFPVGDAWNIDDKIPLAFVLAHQSQAVRNHGQSVHRLAERGGLSWCELAAVVLDRRWQRMDQAHAKAACMRALEQWKAERQITATVGDGAETICGGYRKAPTCQE